jgi:fructosamine-3-kinase
VKRFASLSGAVEALTGDGTVLKRSPLSGGDINRAWKLQLPGGKSLFLKENRRENLPFFETESRSLSEMRLMGESFVVSPMAIGTDRENAFLLLPYLGTGRGGSDSWRIFGRRLAEFHRAGKEDRFGFSEDNYIGSTPQKNGWKTLWVDFFRENRLEYQIRLASAHIDGSLARRFLIFLDRLERYLPEPDKPSLLHGDLWSGNVLRGKDQLWLIDPAAYYGHREADLAMTYLFGGFPGEFYLSYGEANPLEPDFGERKDIYNLYHLLNHLNMFGASYLGSVRAIVERFS